MGINYFAKEQIETLRKNPYVKKVSEKSITYTEEFKKIFIDEYKNGCPPSIILTKYGFSCTTLGESRIKNISNRYRKQSEREQGLIDTRKYNSGRPLTRDLSKDEIIAKQNHKILVLEQENTFLKKIHLIEKQSLRKVKQEKNID